MVSNKKSKQRGAIVAKESIQKKLKSGRIELIWLDKLLMDTVKKLTIKLNTDLNLDKVTIWESDTQNFPEDITELCCRLKLSPAEATEDSAQVKELGNAPTDGDTEISRKDKTKKALHLEGAAEQFRKPYIKLTPPKTKICDNFLKQNICRKEIKRLQGGRKVNSKAGDTTTTLKPDLSSNQLLGHSTDVYIKGALHLFKADTLCKKISGLYDIFDGNKGDLSTQIDDCGTLNANKNNGNSTQPSKFGERTLKSVDCKTVSPQNDRKCDAKKISPDTEKQHYGPVPTTLLVSQGNLNHIRNNHSSSLESNEASHAMRNLSDFISLFPTRANDLHIDLETLYVEAQKRYAASKKKLSFTTFVKRRIVPTYRQRIAEFRKLRLLQKNNNSRMNDKVNSPLLPVKQKESVVKPSQETVQNLVGTDLATNYEEFGKTPEIINVEVSRKVSETSLSKEQLDNSNCLEEKLKGSKEESTDRCVSDLAGRQTNVVLPKILNREKTNPNSLQRKMKTDEVKSSPAVDVAVDVNFLKNPKKLRSDSDSSSYGSVTDLENYIRSIEDEIKSTDDEVTQSKNPNLKKDQIIQNTNTETKTCVWEVKKFATAVKDLKPNENLGALTNDRNEQPRFASPSDPPSLTEKVIVIEKTGVNLKSEGIRIDLMPKKYSRPFQKQEKQNESDSDYPVSDSDFDPIEFTMPEGKLVCDIGRGKMTKDNRKATGDAMVINWNTDSKEKLSTEGYRPDSGGIAISGVLENKKYNNDMMNNQLIHSNLDRDKAIKKNSIRTSKMGGKLSKTAGKKNLKKIFKKLDSFETEEVANKTSDSSVDAQIDLETKKSACEDIALRSEQKQKTEDEIDLKYFDSVSIKSDKQSKRKESTKEAKTKKNITANNTGKKSVATKMTKKSASKSSTSSSLKKQKEEASKQSLAARKGNPSAKQRSPQRKTSKKILGNTKVKALGQGAVKHKTKTKVINSKSFMKSKESTDETEKQLQQKSVLTKTPLKKQLIAKNEVENITSQAIPSSSSSMTKMSVSSDKCKEKIIQKEIKDSQPNEKQNSRESKTKSKIPRYDPSYSEKKSSTAIIKKRKIADPSKYIQDYYMETMADTDVQINQKVVAPVPEGIVFPAIADGVNKTNFQKAALDKRMQQILTEKRSIQIPEDITSNRLDCLTTKNNLIQEHQKVESTGSVLKSKHSTKETGNSNAVVPIRQKYTEEKIQKQAVVCASDLNKKKISSKDMLHRKPESVLATHSERVAAITNRLYPSKDMLQSKPESMLETHSERVAAITNRLYPAKKIFKPDAKLPNSLLEPTTADSKKTLSSTKSREVTSGTIRVNAPLQTLEQKSKEFESDAFSVMSAYKKLEDEHKRRVATVRKHLKTQILLLQKERKQLMSGLFADQNGKQSLALEKKSSTSIDTSDTWSEKTAKEICTSIHSEPITNLRVLSQRKSPPITKTTKLRIEHSKEKLGFYTDSYAAKQIPGLVNEGNIQLKSNTTVNDLNSLSNIIKRSKTKVKPAISNLDKEESVLKQEKTETNIVSSTTMPRISSHNRSSETVSRNLLQNIQGNANQISSSKDIDTIHCKVGQSENMIPYTDQNNSQRKVEVPNKRSRPALYSKISQPGLKKSISKVSDTKIKHNKDLQDMKLKEKSKVDLIQKQSKCEPLERPSMHASTTNSSFEQESDVKKPMHTPTTNSSLEQDSDVKKQMYASTTNSSLEQDSDAKKQMYASTTNSLLQKASDVKKPMTVSTTNSVFAQESDVKKPMHASTTNSSLAQENDVKKQMHVSTNNSSLEQASNVKKPTPVSTNNSSLEQASNVKKPTPVSTNNSSLEQASNVKKPMHVPSTNSSLDVKKQTNNKSIKTIESNRKKSLNSIKRSRDLLEKIVAISSKSKEGNTAIGKVETDTNLSKNRRKIEAQSKYSRGAISLKSSQPGIKKSVCKTSNIKIKPDKELQVTNPSDTPKFDSTQKQPVSVTVEKTPLEGLTTSPLLEQTSNCVKQANISAIKIDEKILPTSLTKSKELLDKIATLTAKGKENTPSSITCELPAVCKSDSIQKLTHDIQVADLRLSMTMERLIKKLQNRKQSRDAIVLSRTSKNNDHKTELCTTDHHTELVKNQTDLLRPSVPPPRHTVTEASCNKATELNKDFTRDRDVHKKMPKVYTRKTSTKDRHSTVLAVVGRMKGTEYKIQLNKECQVSGLNNIGRVENNKVVHRIEFLIETKKSAFKDLNLSYASSSSSLLDRTDDRSNSDDGFSINSKGKSIYETAVKHTILLKKYINQRKMQLLNSMSNPLTTFQDSK